MDIYLVIKNYIHQIIKITKSMYLINDILLIGYEVHINLIIFFFMINNYLEKIILQDISCHDIQSEGFYVTSW